MRVELDNVQKGIKNEWVSFLKRISILISVPIINVIYLILNIEKENTLILKMKIDDVIQFNKIFIIPYVAWYGYVAIFLVLLCILDKKRYFRAVLSLNLGMLISYVIFFILPTHVPRPQIVDTDILSKMVIWIYSNDNPYNCFPSIHVLNTVIINYFVCVSHKFSKLTKVICTLVGISIILSTLYIKQHYFPDVIGGVILALAVCYISSKTNFHKKL
ncbi:phosphatase PAP2 family protein [Hathewaya histolytica]|uniref:phosphatase PAP2 family protein n=1 Tax=Hathewaya histolytica TaxID=1498 RepID=UPI003B66E51B